jgi:hypothetical protein
LRAHDSLLGSRAEEPRPSTEPARENAQKPAARDALPDHTECDAQDHNEATWSAQKKFRSRIEAGKLANMRRAA